MWPVVRTQIELCCHIVDILVDVNELAYLIVRLLGRSCLRKLIPLVERILGTFLLNIARVGTNLKLIHNV